jgi:hypothetical protein
MLVLEAFFGGIFLALTSGLLFVYLVSIGAGVEGISVVVGLSALTKLLIHLALYRYPQALLTKVKPKFVSQQALERLLFVAVPLTQDPLTIAVVYTLIAATPTSTYMNLLIYSSFEEEDIRDVTAKRAAAFGVASIIGFTLAIFLLAFLPPETKFLYTFSMGSAIGLVSTLLIALTDMRHLEGMPVPKGIEQPERLFSTSAYFVAILAGGSLLAMVWVPYVMDYLKGPDYLAVAMNLVTTLTSVVASLFWKNRSYRTLRYSVGLDAATPIMALLVPIPVVHPLLSAYSSFSYTGSNFVGSFLFAGYNRWLGALRSSIFIIIVLCVAQLVVSPVSTLLGGDYLLIFLVVFGVKAAAFALASTTIPEVAVVREQTARAYSSLLYNRSVTGYRVSVELSKETALLTLRLIGLALILLTLYIIYRTLYLLIFL